jgi:hypothetical protein
MSKAANTPSAQPTSSAHCFWISNQARFQSSGYLACSATTPSMVWRNRVPAGMALMLSVTIAVTSSRMNACEYIVATNTPPYQPSPEFMMWPTRSARPAAARASPGDIRPMKSASIWKSMSSASGLLRQ